MSGPGKVLVLGDDTQSFLAVVRSLGRKAIEVHVAPFNFRAPALRSRYVRAIHRLPRYWGTGDAWAEATATLLERERYDLVIPIDDRTLLCFQRFRDRFAHLGTVAIPSDRAIDVFYDKQQTRELATRCGVGVAVGRTLRAEDNADLLAREFGLPLALKPRRSYTLGSLHQRGRVEIVDSGNRLASLLLDIEDRENYLIEAVFPGRGLGVSALAVDGQVAYAFEHHRIHEVRVGGSSLRVSAPLDPSRLEACRRMLGELNYTGVAMFEFRLDSDTGAWILLEVNARFWGSLPLPLSLGLDFPYDLYRLLTGRGKPPARTYRVGVFGRNLMVDIYSATKGEPPNAGTAVKAWAALRRVTPALPRMLTGAERNDTLVADDPGPGIAELRNVIGRKLPKLLRPLRIVRSAASRRRRALRAIARWSLAEPLVFLCQGNVCRSPFAHYLLVRLLGEDAISIVTSAGLLPTPGRSCPEEAVRAARTAGVDLTHHRSRFFDDECQARSGLVVVFDQETFDDLYDRFPGMIKPVLRLTDLLPDGASDISDPWGRDAAFFSATYARIARAVSPLADAVSRSRNQAGTR